MENIKLRLEALIKILINLLTVLTLLNLKDLIMEINTQEWCILLKLMVKL